MGFEFQEGESLSGMVLVATPALLDPHFHQTVVYIAEHSPSGALGFVMNRPLGRTLGEVAKMKDLPASLQEVLVFEGGPVKPNSLVFAQFQHGVNDEDVHCEILADPGRATGKGVRAFVGYSGWDEGQLEGELTAVSWKVCRPHVAMLDVPVPPSLWAAFISEDQRWRKMHSRLPKFPGNN